MSNVNGLRSTCSGELSVATRSIKRHIILHKTHWSDQEVVPKSRAQPATVLDQGASTVPGSRSTRYVEAFFGSVVCVVTMWCTGAYLPSAHCCTSNPCREGKRYDMCVQAQDADDTPTERSESFTSASSEKADRCGHGMIVQGPGWWTCGGSPM